MNRTTRTIILASLLLLPATPAFASPEPAAVTISVAAPSVLVAQVEPAVEVDLFEEDERPESAWTFKALLPFSLFLGGLTVIVSIFLYFPKVVLKRYKTVD